MARTGMVNYHVHRPERQAYHIDAGGVVGALVSPDHDVVEITVRDVRGRESSLTFAQDSVAFLDAPSDVSSFTDDAASWRAQYDRELTGLLTRELEVSEVVVFDHTVRIDDPGADRQPARNVHSDYSPEGARQRLIDLLGEDRAATWSDGHYAFINVWRPIDAPINSAPLGFVRPASVLPEDWLLLDLIYPDRLGSIMGLVASDAHEWVYRSRMTPDEIVYFNIFDNQGLASIAHSAIDMVEDPSVHSVRKSIESRTLVRY